MKRAKHKITLLAFVLILTNAIIAQSNYALAGINGITYFDIVPDTLLNPMSTYSPGGVNDNYYYIDINQDGTTDIKVSAHYGVSPGSTSQNVQLTALDTAIKFSFGKIDSAYFNSNCGGPGYTHIGNALLQYNLNDTIKNGNYVSQGYLSTYVSTPGCGIDYDDTTWIKPHDQYIGVRYNTAPGYLYGWIRVLVSSEKTVLIKDFSLGAPLNSIKTYIQSNIYLYPNPASSNIIVQSGTASLGYLNIYNAVGQKVNQLSTTNTSILIDVSNLPNGIYFIQTKNGLHKFIKN